jgi:PAS domain S-box-containing protein
MVTNLPPDSQKIKFPWMILFSLLIFTVGIIILGRVYYSSQITRINQEAQESLTAIAFLKIRQIEQWRTERLGNAELITNNNPLIKSIKECIANKNRQETEADVKQWMNSMASNYDYKSVIIYDTLQRTRLASTQSDSVLPKITKTAFGEALKDMKAKMTDLYRNGSSGRPAIDLMIPLSLNGKKQLRPVGVIVLRIDPGKTLFPLIQSWPTPSKSGETLLIRKDGDSVLYMNDLRHIQNTALNLRLPLTDKNLPASKAINGFTGMVDGIDYRKVPVVGYVSSIPGLNWFIVAKIDKEEIQAPFERLSIISVSATILLILFIAAVLLFWIRNQQFKQSRDRLRNELGRKQLDEALIISEARYRRLFEAARDGILILEAETGLIVDVNPYLVEMLGVTREKILKKSIWEIGFFKDIAANKEKFLELQQKEYVRYEDLPLETTDGRKFHVEFVSNVCQVNGYPVIQCNIRDITERKQAELMLREEKERIRTILDQVGDPIFLKDNDHRVILANRAFYDIFGMDEKSVIGYTLAEAVPENERHHFLKVDRSVLDTGITDLREEELTVNDFTRTIITRKIRFVDESGKRFLVGSIHDITDRKKMEDELHASENKFRQTFDFSPVGIVMVGFDKKFLRCNNSFAQSLGYLAEELIGKAIADVTFPEDNQIGMNDMSAIIKGELESSNFQKRYVRKDGQNIWGDVLISLIKDVKGNPQYFLAIIQDITERKKTEAKLKESEEQFRTMANAMPQLAWIAKADGYIYWYNKRWYEYTGTTPEQMEGWGWQSVHDPAVLPHVMQSWTNSITSGNNFEMEFPLLGADGEFRTFLTRVQPLRNSSGEIVLWFGTNTDVDTLKQAEGKIKNQMAELKRFNSSMIDRELRMIQLKQEINAFCKQLNLSEKYSIPKVKN